MPNVEFLDFEPAFGNFRNDIINGLSQFPKSLPQCYVYDATGSKLFDQICQLPEYHIPVSERQLMDRIYADLRAMAGPAANIVEFGSGSSLKVRRLLDQLDKPHSVTSIDISKEHLLKATAALADDYPHIQMNAICADFTQLEIELNSLEGLNVGFFPGSTLSNWEPFAASRLLTNLRKMLGRNGVLLIGLDMLQEQELLLRGYQDDKGVNGAFNLNILSRIKKELDAEVEVQAFTHFVAFNNEKSCVEMYLKSEKEQQIVIGDRRFRFGKSENIQVNSSYKFTVEGFKRQARIAGFDPIKHWIHPNGFFAVHWLAVP